MTVAHERLPRLTDEDSRSRAGRFGKKSCARRVLALPIGNWTALGGAAEVTPGQFQFHDLQATNGPRRFYRIR
jgi:hypothetical protein